MDVADVDRRAADLQRVHLTFVAEYGVDAEARAERAGVHHHRLPAIQHENLDAPDGDAGEVIAARRLYQKVKRIAPLVAVIDFAGLHVGEIVDHESVSAEPAELHIEACARAQRVAAAIAVQVVCAAAAVDVLGDIAAVDVRTAISALQRQAVVVIAPFLDL